MNLKGSSTTKVLFSLAIATLLVFSVVAVSAFSGSPGNIVIGIVPEKTNWVPGSSEVYRVDIMADSTGIDNLVRVSNWVLVGPSYVNFVSVSQPSSNDFFTPLPTWYDLRYNDLSARGIQGSESAFHKSGVVASYWFTLDSSAPRGEIPFSLDYVEFAEAGTYEPLPYEIQNSNPVVTSTHGGGKTCPSGTLGKCAGPVSKISALNGDSDLNSDFALG